MNDQIDSALKQARSYWFVDGFVEMAAGGLLILLAKIFLLSGPASQSTFRSWLLSVAGEIAAAKVIGILAAALILWWLKDHFTYPRTGFVRGKRFTATQILIMLRNLILLVLLPILALLGIILLIAPARNVLATMPAWFPIGVGLVWSALTWLGAEWSGLRRFRLLAALIVLSGIAIGVWQLTTGLPAMPANVQTGIVQAPALESINRTLMGLSILILISGGLLMISGFVTFLRYRTENPKPYAEEA